jgi:hypothetical protein
MLLPLPHVLAPIPCWAPSSERTPTLTIPGFSIHDVSVTDLIRNCELPEDGAVLVPKHVGVATF